MARFQITFDAADPDRLAAFWAAALGYQIQPPPEGYDDWPAFLRDQGVEYEEGQANAIVDPEGVLPRIYFQRVPEPKTAKNRVHIDINVSAPAGARKEAVRHEMHRLMSLGAKRVREADESGEFWTVMRDPEGNEFCVQ
jgi:hypothetical protein